ncbi:methyltransferase [Xylariales sp. PMI_506]|nr:methyltransferase [Xylariales sp. PMI_506]
METSKIPENLKQRLKESYDSIAPEYNAWTQPHAELRLKYLNQLLPLLEGPKKAGAEAEAAEVKVLELGCGCGLPVTQALLSRPNFRVVANDLSSAQIDVARANLAPEGSAKEGQEAAQHPRLTLIQGDMAALSFPDGSLDAVVGMYSIIHLPLGEQEQLLARIAGWLRPGGYLLANFSEAAIDGVVNEKWLHEKGWMYWSGFGAEGTLEKIKQAGFQVVSSEVSTDVVDASFIWVIARKA